MRQKGLTPKQRIFIMEYIVYKNATKAAKIAGYSAKTARSIGAENLTKPDIFAAIEKGLSAQLEKAEISADIVTQALKRIAFADPLEGPCFGKLHALELLGKSFGLFKDEPRSKSQAREFSALDLLPPSHIGIKRS